MKFKLVEQTIDNTRAYVQEYMYDAMDELNNASLEEYIQWFKSELTYYDDDVEQAVTDAYIEACDYGMIKGVEKTRLTSELKEYIESHTDIIDDTDELMRQCPGHLQHELKIVLSKLDESLNEELLTEVTKIGITTLLEKQLKSAMYDVVSRYNTNVVSHRGQTSLLAYLCVNNGVSSEGCCIHHIDCNHNNYHSDNVCLIPEKTHKFIHNELILQCIEELLRYKNITRKDDLKELTIDDFDDTDIKYLANLFTTAQLSLLSLKRLDVYFPNSYQSI